MINTDFEQKMRERAQKPLRRRKTSALYLVSMDLDMQSYVDLKEMARAARIAMGAVVDKLIRKELNRREKKMKKQQL